MIGGDYSVVTLLWSRECEGMSARGRLCKRIAGLAGRYGRVMENLYEKRVTTKEVNNVTLAGGRKQTF